MAKKKTISEIREEPGKSNAGKYKNVKSDDFAGPNGTYPINTLKRAKSAMKLSHFAANPGNIVKNVLKKYPELKEEKKSPITYGMSPIKFNGDPDPRKKGKKYKTGSYIDETDHEEGKYTTTNKKLPGNKYNVENLSRIKEDKKGQYMVSLDDSYGPDSETESATPNSAYTKEKRVSNYNQGSNAVRDTLRPKKGKYFKQGWGEKERNVSYNYNK
jgi:hypothetical protein